ncbi:hypothetical protein QOZ88_02855 [Blastococcus sp. BMG 814]|uniref:Integrase n=1 Tax=Blastococcus carthaginiensis TaxID=3050034 RepID=A0ABT9I7N6_9ACTN|nr:hypothetical protein [Blastococcus carthaginiensis]MDP5181564.1 hypothetical protein [Blastococcus carthaginiensis]
MRGLEGVHRRRRAKQTTRQAAGHAPAPDLVGRRFTADQLDRFWGADIGYLRS